MPAAPTPSRTQRTRQLTLVTAATAVVLALGGCSGGSSATTPAGTTSAAPAAAATSATGSTAPSTGSSGTSSPAPSASASASGSSSSEAVALEQSYRQTIRTVLPSVVEIRTSEGLGSGIVYDTQGHIVTNAHVVGSATTFQVLTSGSARPRAAKLTGTYPAGDLAVIQVTDPSGLKPATFARSADAQVGDIVLAMGNPLGLSSTVTNGIISATGRTVSEPAEQGSPAATLPDTIQTSAAINPGNSGGALVDLDSQVVGIPTLAATDSQEGGAAPGIGFAIPSDTVTRIAPQLIRNGRVTSTGRAALGVTVTTVTDQSGSPQGVGVVSVTQGGAAASAGIRAGDVITAVNGTSTPSAADLSSVLASLRVGQRVPVTLQRNGQQQQVQVTLGQLSAG